MKPEIVPIGERDEGLIDLPELVRTFGRYKWGIVGLTLLSAVIAALIAFSLQPMYRGTVVLLIESQNQHVARLQDVYNTDTPELEFLWTQVAILKSRGLARKVVERLDLVGSPEFEDAEPREKTAAKFDLRRYLPFLPERDALEPPPTEEERIEAVVDAFLERLTVEPFGRTQIVKVHYDGYSPQLVARIANALSDVFIESGLEARLDATTRATAWLTNKLSEIQGSLAEAEAELQRFREQEQLVVVGSARALSDDEVLDYSRRLREAQRKRTELQNAYEKIRQAGNNPQRLRDISALLLDPVVQRANASYLDAQEAVKQLQERYGAKHPSMAAAEARLANAEAAFNGQLRIAAQGLRTEYEISLESERALARQVEATRSQIRNLDRKDYELSRLQRDVDTYRELYNVFLTRFKETDVAGSFQSISARVVDPATEPRTAQWPQKKKIVVLAALAGLVGAILLAILHHLLSEGFSSAEELEALTQLPVLGVLPLVSGFIGKKLSNLPKYLLDKPRTPFAEGVRSTCAALKLSDIDRTLKRIMVTSSVPEEGKSSVSATLALTLGANENVLLVETDLRKPSLRRLFDIGGKLPLGISDILSGTQTLDACLHHHEQGNIWILPAGRTPPSPTDALGSRAFAELLAELGTRFDRIILDSPPTQSAADALVLGRQCDACLFVVKSDATARRAVKNSLKQLRFASIPIAGLVVNQVDVRHNPNYAYSYNYVYGYYG